MTYWTGDPIEVGTTEQLLIDDYILEDVWDMKRRLCRPIRHPIGPVLHIDKPWEEKSIIPWRVLYDERDRIYRMYYNTTNVEAWQYQFAATATLRKQWSMAKHGPAYMTCYAESSDGLHWEKPMLDAVSWRGYDKTNIIMTGRTKSQCVDVVRNPDPADEKRRYIMIYRDRADLEAPQGRFLAYSSDGVRFTEDPANPIITGARDGSDALVWDPQKLQWLYFIRPTVLAFDHKGALDPPPGNIKRRPAVTTSLDLREWTFPRTLLYPDERDVTCMCLDQFTPFKYGSHFIGLLSILDESREGDMRGMSETQIASSADGFHWHRTVNREAFLACGPPGSFDVGQAMMTAAPVTTSGNNWLFYYCGTVKGQKAGWHNLGAVGVAVLPKGRIVGLFAEDRDGFILTKELIVGGKHLEINCETLRTGLVGAGAQIRVGILRRPRKTNLHEGSEYCDGFSIEDCDKITWDHGAFRVTWNDKDDLSALVGKPVYLRAHVRQAGLYSFRFVDE